MPSIYDNPEIIDAFVAEGRHRYAVGDLWEEVGPLQTSFLVTMGLQAHHRLLDIGCGALRGGVNFVQHLSANHYFGIDVSPSLLEAGYRELSKAGLANKLSRDNLRVVKDFDATAFGVTFDYAIAFSVFTHLPLNSIRICLEKLTDVMPQGGQFFATFFEIPAEWTTSKPFNHSPGNVETRGDDDPYHYRVNDMTYAAASLPWDVAYIGEFGHPRGQKMIRFTRT